MKNSVYVVAPSSAPKDKKWKKGIQILENWGLKVFMQNKMIYPTDFHSHSNQKRAYFLNQAFDSKKHSLVWMLRGGYGTQKLLPLLNKKILKSQNKLFIGYSDGTAIHMFLNAYKKKSLHAPTVSELADLSVKELSSLKQLVLGTKTKINFNQLKSFKSHSKKTLVGKIRGGNLSIISTMIGTSFFSTAEFLFLEDVNEEPYKVDRMLHHLYYSGSLKSVKAILFGGFYPLKNPELKKILTSFSQVCSVPFIFNLPCGHKNKQPLFFNTKAQLTITAHKAQLEVNTK